MRPKKLSLNKETLRGLSAEDLAAVAGAGIVSAVSNCGNCTANLTCFCPNTGHAPCSVRTGCCPAQAQTIVQNG